ncbi:MAG: carbohydrate deacetylase [Terriglobales bacterium]
MKRLIVNADDFGMTKGVNRAVADAHRTGIITSTTLMATGTAFQDAARVARANPSLGVGCHVVLVEGSPLLSAAQIPNLALETPAGIAYRHNFGQFVRSALLGHIPSEEITREASAQITKLQNAGIAVTHLDTHKHAHVFPEIFRPLLRAASACGVRAIRNPFEPTAAISLRAMLPRPELARRLLPVRLLRVFAAEFQREVQAAGLLTTDGTLGITLTGMYDWQAFDQLLSRIPDGTWELLCHPAYEDELWRALGPRPGSGEKELVLFGSEWARGRLARLGVDLITYRDLTAEQAVAAA